MKFKFLTGDVNWQEYGGKFISKKLNNGDFNYWLVMEVINWNEHENEPEYTYHVQLCAVSPQEAANEIPNALNSWGMSLEELAEYGKSEIVLVDLLSSYMGGALIWQSSGNNLRKLMQEARREAKLSTMLFGFYMDKPQNAIGSTGWDVISGDILAGLNR